jgi:predicted RNA binding protein YcfA (HicA-like mRNA interferase family)
LNESKFVHALILKDVCVIDEVASEPYHLRRDELLRRLRRLGAAVISNRGKGGHVRVELYGRTTIVPTGSREIRTGTFYKILRNLGLRPEDLR